MQQTTSATAIDTDTAVARFRPTLVYSADGERCTVDGWMRAHGLWRTSLYHLLQRFPELRLAIEGDELSYRPLAADGFVVRLAQDAADWAVHAGGLAVRFADASHAVGIFCASVSGAARIVVASAGHGMVEHRLQLAEADGWIDVVVARDWCERTGGVVLANPVLVSPR